MTVTIGRRTGKLRFRWPTTAPGSTAGPAGSGHGFVNMSDRLGAIGGTLTVDSAPGQGTRISGVIPVD